MNYKRKPAVQFHHFIHILPCIVTPKEIRRLYKRFQKLDKSGTGRITTDDFLAIPELAMNPLVMRVISLFDTKGDDHVNFPQFISTLSVFSKRGDPKDKIRCMCYNSCMDVLIHPSRV